MRALARRAAIPDDRHVPPGQHVITLMCSAVMILTSARKHMRPPGPEASTSHRFAAQLWHLLQAQHLRRPAAAARAVRDISLMARVPMSTVALQAARLSGVAAVYAPATASPNVQRLQPQPAAKVRRRSPAVVCRTAREPQFLQRKEARRTRWLFTR